MLTFRITDNDGHTVLMEHPMSVSISSSESAPADSLRAVFAVEGDVPELCRIEVFDEDETVFSGAVDSQAEEYGLSGHFLTVYARSRAAILLDNEAKPQTYRCPSMRLLMKRHFEPLGFDRFSGSDKVFSGELTVTKGMSEWAVLKKFAVLFLNTEPRIDRTGTIDVSGCDGDAEILLPSEGLISFRRELKNSALVSEIRARTRPERGYDMLFASDRAKRSGVCRRRYISTADNRSGSITGIRRILEKSDAAYKRVIAECRGRVRCRVRDTLLTDRSSRSYRVTEVNYISDSRGERTKIFAEVKST